MCRRENEARQAICNAVIEKIRQRSTWQGVALIASLFGVHLAPEYIEVITGIVGVIATKNIIIDN